MNIKDVMEAYFLNLDRSSMDQSKRIAWCTSVGPAEILRAMDFEVFFPENHGAMLGASRMSMDTIPIANAYGYSPNICSYLTSDIGAYLKKVTPLTKAYQIQQIPKPDILVYNTNQCKDVMHWFEFYAREFNCPIVGIHSPAHLNKVEDAHIDNVVSQFRTLISILEDLTQTKLSNEKLSQTVSLSKEATDLWEKVLSTCKTKPSPMNFFDATIYMGPIVVLRGTQVAKEYYQCLLKELQEKIQQGIASVPNEKKRIYWDGMPIWGRLRAHADLFNQNQACVVASTYCNSWIFSDFDPNDPLRSMANSYLKIFINRNDSYKEEYILKLMKEFHADGIIFHEAMTCPNNSNSLYNLPNRIKKQGIPYIKIHGDLCDLRCYSDEQSLTLIEAFLETL